MWHSLSQIILRHRLAIFIVIGVLTGLFGYFAVTNIALDNKYGNVLPNDSAPQRDYKGFKKIFGEDGGTLIFALEQEDFYSVESITTWKKLADSIRKIDGVLSVISEADLVRLKKDPVAKTFSIEPIIDTITKESIKKAEAEIRNHPFYEGLFFMPDKDVTLMMINIDEKFLESQQKASVVIDVENIAKGLTKDMGRIRYAGLPHIRVVIGKRIFSEMYIFIAASILVTSLLIFIFFRSFKVVWISNFVVLIAVVWSLGSIGMFGFKLSILMALIPPLMIVIGIPNCIFIFNKYHQEVKNHGGKALGLTRVIMKVGNATFLTNLTTSLGFLTFIFTNSEKLIQFGIVASVSILGVFILSICLIPIISSYSKVPSEKHLKHLDKKFSKGLVEKFVWIATYKRPLVYIASIAIVIVGVYGVTKMEATGNLTGDLPDDDPILKDIQFMENTFGGAIPFEIMIDYKKASNLYNLNTLKKVESIQTLINNDTAFSKSLSIVDFVKILNYSFYHNDSADASTNLEKFELFKNRDKRHLKPYIKAFNANSTPNTKTNSPFQISEIVDTSQHILRIRSTMKDYGSYEIDSIVNIINHSMDTILNPDKNFLNEHMFHIGSLSGDKLDTVLANIYERVPSVYAGIINLYGAGDDDLQYELDADPNKIYEFHHNPEFKSNLQTVVNDSYFDITTTGTAVVVSQGTQYLVKNLILSLCIAIVIIAILMAILFRSFKMVLISLIPNFIPLLTTAAIMGFTGIPIKPSTVLIFSIAFGISVDDTIHFLAKFRQELKNKELTVKECVINALRETGLSMFYTSIVLFFGFNMFSLSQFGGTSALGMLVSLTLLVAMITNLILLPSLLMSFDRKATSRYFEEPFFEIYDEEEENELAELSMEKNTKLQE
jgi:predicted RND superfamily exporter protein